MVKSHEGLISAMSVSNLDISQALSKKGPITSHIFLFENPDRPIIYTGEFSQFSFLPPIGDDYEYATLYGCAALYKKNAGDLLFHDKKHGLLRRIGMELGIGGRTRTTKREDCCIARTPIPVRLVKFEKILEMPRDSNIEFQRAHKAKFSQVYGDMFPELKSYKTDFLEHVFSEAETDLVDFADELKQRLENRYKDIP